MEWIFCHGQWQFTESDVWGRVQVPGNRGDWLGVEHGDIFSIAAVVFDPGFEVGVPRVCGRRWKLGGSLDVHVRYLSGWEQIYLGECPRRGSGDHRDGFDYDQREKSRG